MIVLVCILTILVIFGITLHYYLKGEKISFKNTMGSYNLPIVCLYSNGKKLNFIVDTGASNSVLDLNSLNSLASYKKLETENCTLYGMDGNPVNVEYINTTLYYGNTKINEDFQILEVPAVKVFKATQNIDIAGFLGSSFLKKHKVNIDFEKHTVNIPKKLFLMITKNGLSRN